MRITVSLRELLRQKAAQNIIKQLYQDKHKHELLLYLPTSNNCINEQINKYAPHRWLPDKLFEDCIEKLDGPLFSELKNSRVINNFSIDETEPPDTPPDESWLEWMATVTGIDNQRIAYLHQWIKEINFIVDYGIVSLNKLTGIVYYEDRPVRFYKNTGLFRLLKAFLETPTHSLPYLQMVTLHSGTSPDEGDNPKEKARELIKELGKKLQVKEKLFDLFVDTENSYFLRDGL